MKAAEYRWKGTLLFTCISSQRCQGFPNRHNGARLVIPIVVDLDGHRVKCSDWHLCPKNICQELLGPVESRWTLPTTGRGDSDGGRRSGGKETEMRVGGKPRYAGMSVKCNGKLPVLNPFLVFRLNILCAYVFVRYFHHISRRLWWLIGCLGVYLNMHVFTTRCSEGLKLKDNGPTFC